MNQPRPPRLSKDRAAVLTLLASLGATLVDVASGDPAYSFTPKRAEMPGGLAYLEITYACCRYRIYPTGELVRVTRRREVRETDVGLIERIGRLLALQRQHEGAAR